MGKLGDNKKGYLFLPLVLVLLTVTSIVAFTSISHEPTEITPGVKYESVWCYEVERANGDYENLGCKHNVVYNSGLEQIEQALRGYANLTATTVSLCNNTAGKCATPAATEAETFNKMSGCGLTDNTTTVLGSNGGSNGNWTVLASFVSSCDGIIVNVTKLKDKNSEINLSGNTFTDTTLNNGDTLTVNTTLFVQSG